MKRFLYLLVVLLVTSNNVAGDKYVICYYSSRATEYSGLGKFGVGNINPRLCTHAVYISAEFDTEGIVMSSNPGLDLPENKGRNYYGLFNELKRKNPNLKTLLSVGGPEMSDPFSIIAENSTTRKNFVASAVTLIQKYGFNGLDISWEYPNVQTSNGDDDLKNFVELLRELKETFRRNNLILSATVMAVRFVAATSYNIPDISRFLDLINLMTYDYNGSWDNVTGHNAGLHKGEGDEKKSRLDCFTIDVDVEFWLRRGAPREKLVIGLPFYGRTFNLSNPDNSKVAAPSAGFGIKGMNTQVPGYIGYNEFCIKLRSEPWTQKFDTLARVPYAFNGYNWVSYDNVDSVTQKVQYAMKQRLGGVFIWTIDLDDFHGTCGSGDFPLLRAVNKAMGKSIQ